MRNFTPAMRQIIVYSLVLGGLLALIQYARYRFVLIQHAESFYTGLTAVICCGAGLWAGVAMTRQIQRRVRAIDQKETPRQKLQGLSNRPDMPLLSPRENEVLQLMAQGLSNQEIASRLFLSLNTVKTHVSNLFAKLDVQRRTQAIQKAQSLGLLGETDF